MNSTPFNAWKLVSLSPLSPWTLGLLGALLAAGVLLAAIGLQREPELRRRIVLWGLRIGAGVAAAFFLFEPGVRNLQVAHVKNRIAVLVDRSASMNFPAVPGGKSRLSEVADYLESVSSQLSALQDRFTIEYYGFDPELAPITPQTLRSQAARGPRTDLLSALRSVKSGEQSTASKKLSGVLLFSDGADNADLAAGVAGRGRAALVDYQVPVSTFVVGSQGLKDLAVEQIKVDDFAFVRNSIAVEVEIRGRGFKGQTVPVVLRREGQTVASKSIQLASDDEVHTVSFNISPDQTGRFVYTASVPVFPQEVVIENNTRSFALKVIRDRVRVLLVVGRPSWDERFLRGLLRQDANVDLVSFYILRTLSSEPQVMSDRELSLIPFPMEEIFDAKLDTFDVVIFQNFGYTDPSLSVALYEKNLERYVHNGGGFLMIGGDHAFGEGRSNFPVLGQAMPVEPAGRPATVDSFKPRLTPEGLRHPVTSFSQGAANTEQAWSTLPAIPGANLTRVKPGATVLLDHPFQTLDGKNAPVLALWEYGRGRAMALTVDSSWYWAFASHVSGSPSRLYDRFWGNALRWLVRDPDLTTLTVTADPPSVEPGKPIGVVVAARTPDYQPAAEAEVRVELFSVKAQRSVATQRSTTGPDGMSRLEFPPPEPGAYKILAWANKGEKSLGEGEDAVAVRAVGPELSDASVRADILEQIARATGGKAYALAQGSLPEIPLLDPPVVEVGRSKDEPIWDRWYYLITLVALLGTEWLLRRRFGYI
ncbi:MAG TPA: glutamine amidotransferase [Myxococcaceae bacterium]|nr:glutamine amidotransferase [Myxococcaceae bacterium]